MQVEVGPILEHDVQVQVEVSPILEHDVQVQLKKVLY